MHIFCNKESHTFANLATDAGFAGTAYKRSKLIKGCLEFDANYETKYYQ